MSQRVPKRSGGFEEKRAPLRAKRELSIGAALPIAAGLLMGQLFRGAMLGVLLLPRCHARRDSGLPRTGDGAVAGAPVFVALVATGTDVTVYGLGP